MKPSILKYAAPITLSVMLCSGADLAQAKGRCILFCGDSKAAEDKAVEPAASANSANLDVAIEQAQAARKKGDLADATKILSQLVLFAPDDARVLGEYGKTLVAQGKSDDALAFLERAIQLMPSDWSLYSAQGVAYDQKGVYPSAQLAYSRALSLQPNEPTVLNNAALSHMQSGDLDGAEQLLQQASPGSAEFARIAQNLALVQGLKQTRSKQAALKPAANAAPPAAPVPPAPPPQVRAAPVPIAPAIVSAPIEPMPLPAPALVQEPVQASASTETAGVSAKLTGLAALKADPTVRMAPVPKEEPVAPKPPAAKPAPAPKVQVAENKVAAVPAPKPAADGPPARPPQSAMTYYVQAGAYASEERADKMAHDLDSMGARVSPATVDGHSVYRVRIGPFRDVRQANTAIDRAQSMGQNDLKIVSE